MIGKREFLRETRIESTTLEAWLNEGWLKIEATSTETSFTECDVARAQFILDLRERLGVNEAGIDVVLELVDQIHGLRHALAKAVQARKQ
jgi:chaperone modulatory protein CbpM